MKYTTTTLAGVTCYLVPCDELDALRIAARALKALLARELSYADNFVYFPFESSTQAFNHILDARDAAIAAEENSHD